MESELDKAIQDQILRVQLKCSMQEMDRLNEHWNQYQNFKRFVKHLEDKYGT